LVQAYHLHHHDHIDENVHAPRYANDYVPRRQLEHKEKYRR